MKSKLNPFLSSLIAITMVQSASAETGLWVGDFDGTWDTSDVNWTDVTTSTPWDNINGPGNTATFNTALLAAEVSGTVDTNGITFTTTGALSGGTINLAGFPTIAVAAGQTGTISSTVSGTTGLTKADVGILKLSAATYTGGTTVSEGRLVLENTMTGNRNYTTDAELEFNLFPVDPSTGNQQIESGNFDGTGKLIKTGASELVLGNWGGAPTVALTGGDSVIDVQAGTLSHFGPAGPWAPAVNWTGNEAGLTVATGAAFQINNNNTIVDELNGAGTINKGTWDAPVTLTIGVTDGSGTFSGTISDPAQTLALVKEGTGTQTLNGSVTYRGGTTVNGGRLVLMDTKTGNQSFTTNAELEFKLTAATQQFQGGAFSGTGKLIKTGANELILSGWEGSQTVALTGADSIIDVQEGTLTNFTGSGAWGAPLVIWTGNEAGLTVASGATFQIENNSTIVDELNGEGTITKNEWDTPVTLTIGVKDGSGTFSGAIIQTVGQTLSLVKQGTGTQTLSGVNSYNGATTVSAGTLALVGGSQASPITVSASASLGFTLGSPTTSSSSFNLTDGSVKITGTPDGTSTYTLITASSGITGTPTLHTPVSGYALEVDGTSLKLVPDSASGFSTWAATNAPGQTPAQDFDGDGVTNGVEYVVGGTKNTNDLSKLPKISSSGSDMLVTFDRDQASIDGTTILTIKVGTDLVSWPDSYNVPGTALANNPGVTVAKDSSPGFDKITLTIPRAPDAKKFARLEVVTE